MTTAAVAGLLLALAVLDGTFAGFRSSLGRTGLIDHSASDRRAALRGTILSVLFLAPLIVAVSADVATHPSRMRAYRHAGQAMLAVYGPYALLTLLALLSYAVLGLRQRYLASALILGPFTFLRPLVALAGAVLAAFAGHDAVVALIVCLAAGAVLTVEPVADHLWYTDRLPYGG